MFILRNHGGKQMKRQPSSQALCAKAIRNELKAAFPNTKFSVTSDCGANTNSVDINWTDGETEEIVNKIVSKYQYGHFNGMEDIYEHSNSREDIPQAKFVFTNRRMSEDTQAAIIKKHNEEFCEARW